MASSQLTSRQKMINMMYLVLTAILALNVSSEVLDAFKSVNDGIDISNTSLESKNTGMYSVLGREFQNDSIRAKAAYEKSKKAREVSAKLFAQLEQYKKQMIQEAGGIDAETGKIKRDDDLEIATRLFVEKNGKEGKLLKQEIEKARQELLSLVEEDERAQMESSFALKIDKPASDKPWEYARFNQVPVVAAVTLLTKYQNDVLSAENHIIETLYGTIGDKIERVDKLEAKIISPTSYILQGEAYKADVMVAAYNSTQSPDVFLGQFNGAFKKDAAGNYAEIISTSGGPPLLNPVKVDVQGGFGKIQMAGNATGNKKYTGVVRIKGKAGEYKFYPFDGEYQVAPKVAVVSPQKMNVLYIGLDNPVDISVPGVAQSDVSAVFEGNGTLAKNEDGSYKALVSTPGTTKVKVSAKINGKQLPMGEQTFRIKRIPMPRTTLDGTFEGGNALGKTLELRKGVVPKSDDFIYGEIQWKVISYTVGIRKKIDFFPIENNGPLLNEKAKALMKGLDKGDAVFIDNIMVKGPDNEVRKISSIAFNITGK